MAQAMLKHQSLELEPLPTTQPTKNLAHQKHNHFFGGPPLCSLLCFVTKRFTKGVHERPLPGWRTQTLYSVAIGWLASLASGRTTGGMQAAAAGKIAVHFTRLHGPTCFGVGGNRTQHPLAHIPNVVVSTAISLPPEYVYKSETLQDACNTGGGCNSRRSVFCCCLMLAVLQCGAAAVSCSCLLFCCFCLST